jgi:predicted transcriptional regulator YdeE
MDVEYQVTISEWQTKTLYGVSVRTNMAKASTDCPELWQKHFGPRMPEISGKPIQEFQGDSYGLSVTVDWRQESFDYWAAMEPANGLALPEGMATVTIPAGLYAGCHVSSLAEIGSAYTFLYMKWPTKQSEYTLNMQAPCFERYGQTYMQDGSFELFVPVIKK